MHATALECGERFFDFYWKDSFKKILDVGSSDVNGTLRKIAPKTSTYVGMDLTLGPGVDIALGEPGNSFPFDAAEFDVVVSTSCFEHDQFFWLTFEEMLRVTAEGGFIYINAPSNGIYHSYPYDNWRFFPDAGCALEAWGKKLGYSVRLIESFINRKGNGLWNDCVMVFMRDQTTEGAPQRLLIDHYSNALNGRSFRSDSIVNFNNKNEDIMRIGELESEIARTKKQVQRLEKHNQQLSSYINSHINEHPGVQ